MFDEDPFGEISSEEDIPKPTIFLRKLYSVHKDHIEKIPKPDKPVYVDPQLFINELLRTQALLPKPFANIGNFGILNNDTIGTLLRYIDSTSLHKSLAVASKSFFMISRSLSFHFYLDCEDQKWNKRFNDQYFNFKSTMLHTVILNWCTVVTEDAIISLSNNCPNIQNLQLEGLSLFGSECFESMLKWKRLTTLNIAACTGIKAIDLCLLCDAPALRMLSVRETTGANDLLFQNLERCTTLEILECSPGCSYELSHDASILAYLKRYKNLKGFLYAGKTKQSFSTIEVLKHFEEKLVFFVVDFDLSPNLPVLKGIENIENIKFCWNTKLGHTPETYCPRESIAHFTKVPRLFSPNLQPYLQDFLKVSFPYETNTFKKLI